MKFEAVAKRRSLRVRWVAKLLGAGRTADSDASFLGD